MHLAPDVVVANRFRLEQEIGRGGVGVVWAARHTLTSRRVALKFVQQPAHARDTVRKRFALEARAAGALDHPNAVKVIDVHEVDDATLVMVMEWLDGETFGEKLRREVSLPVDEAATLLLPVVSAVGTAHAMGIVHRDLKPDNIFLTKHKNVKVLDFGLAKLVGSEEGVTQTGALVGTPAYMPPEQGAGDEALDHRADVWAIGAILFEALTGGRPVDGSTIAQVVRRLLEDGIPPLEAVAPHVPSDVASLVDAMLARDVEDRLPDLLRAAEVLGAYTDVEVPPFGAPNTRAPISLDDLAPKDSMPHATQPTLDGGTATEARPETTKSSWGLWVAGGVAAAGLVVWQWGSPSPPASVQSVPSAPAASGGALPVEASGDAAASSRPMATASATTHVRPRGSTSATVAPTPRPRTRGAPLPEASAEQTPAAPPPPARSAEPQQPPEPGGGLRLDPPF